ncbi:MAG: ATP-binding cassette domain-containing protein [Chloroflexota bacterium]|nr:ATP-binding cassette domain-containing protein [Chloroflexota bacterium]
MLRVEQVTKRFGDVIALNSVSVEAGAGEIVAILGENGAGKSTLLSCIAGFAAPDAGSIAIGGEALRSGEPSSAIQLGVGTAFQHFSLVSTFTVTETCALAGLNAADWSRRLPQGISGSSRIGDLGIAERQQVEFLKARLIGRKLLLLDEPTSPLGEHDVDRVLRDIASVADDGTTVLFVTHRLREALAVADRILVMRHGFVVGEWRRLDERWESGIESELLSAMFGSSADDRASKLPTATRNRAKTLGSLVITDVSDGMQVELLRGHVHAIVGVAGNGQQRLAQMLSADRRVRVDIENADGTRSVQGEEWLRGHASVIPEDRIAEGGAPEMGLGETLVLRDLAQGREQHGGLVSRRGLKRRAKSMINYWSISPAGVGSRFGDLSGGNMQRVILARALDPEPDLLVAVNATQGLDAATSDSVRERLRESADRGTVVVSFEQDVDDALRFADRVSVMFQGQVSAPVEIEHVDRNQLQRMMVAGW